MNNALVLGGRTGLLGQALVRILRQKGWEIETLGREDGNLFDSALLQHRLKTIAPKFVFNTIAWTQVDNAEDAPQEAMRWNADFPLFLAKCLKGSGSHLIHYSTDFVFSGKGEHKLDEKAETVPVSVYGSTKLVGEKNIQEILPQNSAILRTAWLFGPGRKNFVQTMIDLSSKHDMLRVVCDQTGCPTYSLDLAVWSAVIAEKRLTGIYHTVNSGKATWYELASEAIRLSGNICKVMPIASAEWPQKAARPAYSVLNTEKLIRDTDIHPRPWQEALADYVNKEMPHDVSTR